MGRRPRRRERPDRPPPGGVFDWSDQRAHWRRVALPCRHKCGGLPTHLRDSSGLPAHKVCAETAYARQAQEYAEAYENERLRFP
jgi:hypothetical protein